MNEPQPAPYPADTRARGWRLELDYERIEQSDTWALADAETRPWLLMMWMVAWKQVPAGSMPNDEKVIAAKLGMPARAWARSREILLRGWSVADDGRLYHAVITEQVLAMLAKHDKERTRKANWRARKSRDVPRDNHGTDTEGTCDGQGKDDTYHLPPTTIEVIQEDYPPPFAGARAKDRDAASGVGGDAGRLVWRLRRAGISRANPANATLRELLAAGATAEEFLGMVPQCLDKADPFSYLLACVVGERKRAAQLGGQIHRGPLTSVNRQQAIEDENRRVGAAWAASQGASA